MAHPLCQLDAVHARHLPVQVQRLVGLALGHGTVQHVQRPGARLGGVDLQVQVGQQAAQQQARRLVVVHHQDALALKVVAQQLGHHLALALAQPRREPEGAALAVHAVHAHFAAHEVCDLLGDGQAQAGAAVLTRGGGIGLLEALEQLGHLLWRQADTGVGHGAPNQDVVVGLLLDGHRNRDLALLGELDGIVRVVDQDLPQAQRVAHHALRKTGVDVKQQLQPLGCGLLGNQVGHVLQHLVEREVDRLDVELAGLDLGVVQDVVDDAQQVLAGRMGLLDIVALTRIQVGLQQQVGHAHDGVHRRADLMAHVGQED